MLKIDPDEARKRPGQGPDETLLGLKSLIGVDPDKKWGILTIFSSVLEGKGSIIAILSSHGHLKNHRTVS